MYARYSVMTLIEVTTKYADAYRQIRTDSTLVITIELAGVRCFVLTCLMSPEPGMPSSRANAYHIRAIEVIDARPHSHMATPMITAIRFAKKLVRLPYTIWSTG